MKGENVMKREYLCKVVCADGRILYIGYVFGKYKVFGTNAAHDYNYCLASYKRLGNAENTLYNTAQDHGEAVEFYYQSKELLHKNGAFA